MLFMRTQRFWKAVNVMVLFVMCVFLRHTRTLESYRVPLISLATRVLSSLSLLENKPIRMAMVFEKQWEKASFAMRRCIRSALAARLCFVILAGLRDTVISRRLLTSSSETSTSRLMSSLVQS